MNTVPWWYFLVAITILAIMMSQLHGYGISETVDIQGVRVKLSLDEIFKTFMKPGGISPIGILNSSRGVVWTKDIQLELSDAYYNIEVYTILIEKPITLNIESVPQFERETAYKMEEIFHRKDIFLGFTDILGGSLNSMFLSITRVIIIILIVFILLAAILKIFHGFIAPGTVK